MAYICVECKQELDQPAKPAFSTTLIDTGKPKPMCAAGHRLIKLMPFGPSLLTAFAASMGLTLDLNSSCW